MPDRAIRWEGFHNARDLGGLPTTRGGTTRHGVFIRSADPRFVTDAGWRSAFGAGVRTVIDLRNDDEVTPCSASGATLAAGTFAAPAASNAAERPAGMRTVQVPLDDIDDTAFWRPLNEQGLNGTPLYFAPFIAAKPARIAAVLTAVARAGHGGVIFHCGAGRDRAGLVSLLLLSLAGVTPDAIAEDYELSLGEVGPLFAALGLEHREPDMHAQLRQRGSTVRQVVLDLLAGLDVPRYLAAAGVPEADVAVLQGRLL